MCRRRGAIVATAPIGGLRIIKGADSLRTYQFNTDTAKHFFCSTCGIYTHHQRRSYPAPCERIARDVVFALEDFLGGPIRRRHCAPR